MCWRGTETGLETKTSKLFLCQLSLVGKSSTSESFCWMYAKCLRDLKHNEEDKRPSNFKAVQADRSAWQPVHQHFSAHSQSAKKEAEWVSAVCHICSKTQHFQQL